MLSCLMFSLWYQVYFFKLKRIIMEAFIIFTIGNNRKMAIMVSSIQAMVEDGNGGTTIYTVGDSCGQGYYIKKTIDEIAIMINNINK